MKEWFSEWTVCEEKQPFTFTDDLGNQITLSIVRRLQKDLIGKRHEWSGYVHCFELKQNSVETFRSAHVQLQDVASQKENLTGKWCKLSFLHEFDVKKNISGKGKGVDNYYTLIDKEAAKRLRKWLGNNIYRGPKKGLYTTQQLLAAHDPEPSCTEYYPSFKSRADFTECAICSDHDAIIMLEPCKHVCVCESCSNRVNTCPVCRTKISSKNNVETYSMEQLKEIGAYLSNQYCVALGFCTSSNRT